MASILRLIAVTASAVVAITFLFFAVEEMERGSKTQQNAIGQATGSRGYVAPPSPTPEEEVIRERQHGKPRELLEDANDVLLMPFAQAVAGSNSNWVTHGVPAALALLVYGLGLFLAANFIPRAKAGGGDWRTAAS